MLLIVACKKEACKIEAATWHIKVLKEVKEIKVNYDLSSKYNRYLPHRLWAKKKEKSNKQETIDR